MRPNSAGPTRLVGVKPCVGGVARAYRKAIPPIAQATTAPATNSLHFGLHMVASWWSAEEKKDIAAGARTGRRGGAGPAGGSLGGKVPAGRWFLFSINRR